MSLALTTRETPDIFIPKIKGTFQENLGQISQDVNISNYRKRCLKVEEATIMRKAMKNSVARRSLYCLFVFKAAASVITPQRDNITLAASSSNLTSAK